MNEESSRKKKTVNMRLNHCSNKNIILCLHAEQKSSSPFEDIHCYMKREKKATVKKQKVINTKFLVTVVFRRILRTSWQSQNLKKDVRNSLM